MISCGKMRDPDELLTDVTLWQCGRSSFGSELLCLKGLDSRRMLESFKVRIFKRFLSGGWSESSRRILMVFS